MSQSQDINVLLEGSSYSLYSLFDKNALMQHPSSKVIVDNGSVRVVLHYPGWPSGRKEATASLRTDAVIMLYEVGSDTEDIAKDFSSLDDGAALMYSICYDEQGEGFKCTKNAPNLARQLLNFTIAINEPSATRALRLIIEDIHARKTKSIKPVIITEKTPLIPKDDKCTVM